MPGALGWVSISYEPLLVRALGAGPLLTLTLTPTPTLTPTLTLTLTLTLTPTLNLTLALTLTRCGRAPRRRRGAAALGRRRA